MYCLEQTRTVFLKLTGDCWTEYLRFLLPLGRAMPKCILIADDNDIVRTLIRFFLESHQGFEVCGEAATAWMPSRRQKTEAGLDRIGFGDATDERSRSGVRAEGRNARRPDCSVHDV
jgi:hypothetical protein